MIKKALFAILFLFLIAKSYDCYAQSISSTELINNAKSYDGNTVVYKGEVIGDIMLRGEYAWINVNDEKNAIGIWIKKELIKDILCAGSYNSRGDMVEITGKFNRSCIEHGGDLDIHAQSITKISAGSKITYPLDKKEINLVLGLSGIIAAACLLRLITKKFKIKIPPIYQK
jgi:aspartyl/asparaginyl-tRNA synthetase